MHANLLLEFCSRLDLKADEIRKCESLERFSLVATVLISKLKTISAGTFEEVVSAFGTSLELTVGIEDAPPLVNISPDLPKPNFNDAINAISQLPDDMDLRVRIQIQKPIIVQGLSVDLSKYHVLYYLFLENLIKLLSASLADLDEQLFINPNIPTVVVLSDTDLVCRGTFFTVVGGNHIQQLDQHLPKLTERAIQRVTYFRNIANENLNWVDFRLEKLTPIHFLCAIEGDFDNLAAIIANKLVESVIIFTANRSIIEDKNVKAFYASSEQTLELITIETPEVFKNRLDIIRLIRWLEASQKADKLLIFQNTVAREVSGEDKNQNFINFIERLPHILQESLWNYRVYLDGKITKHFEKVEEATEKVTSVSSKVSDAIDLLTKGFADTLLASVGIVILTLIASLAENKTPGLIFKVGMWIYAGYLLVFQVIYRMGHLYYSTDLTLKEGEQQIAPYRIALGTKKVDELTSFLSKRKRYFQIIFWGTVFLFILVILVITLSGALLPNVISPTNTPTPTPTVLSPTSNPVSNATATIIAMTSQAITPAITP
jgi:hypothetical protein